MRRSSRRASCQLPLPEPVRITVLDLSEVPREAPREAIRQRLLGAGLRQLGQAADVLAVLHRDPLGRPAPNPPLHVSLSYTAGRALCALSADGAVGIDVEALDAEPPGRTGLYLSARERLAAGTDPPARLALWTQKEAVAKAAGIGGLRRLGHVGIDGDRAQVGARIWHTRRLELGPGFVAHLACGDPAPRIELLRLAPGTLL